jgi:hypothetical protein
LGGSSAVMFFGPKIALAYRLDAISQGLKALDFQGLTPYYLS